MLQVNASAFYILLCSNLFYSLLQWCNWFKFNILRKLPGKNDRFIMWWMVLLSFLTFHWKTFSLHSLNDHYIIAVMNLEIITVRMKESVINFEQEIGFVHVGLANYSSIQQQSCFVKQVCYCTSKVF